MYLLADRTTTTERPGEGGIVQLADGSYTNVVGMSTGKATTTVNGDRWELVNGKMTLTELGDYALDAAVGQSAVARLNELQLDKLNPGNLAKLIKDLESYQTKLNTFDSGDNQLLEKKVSEAYGRVSSLLKQLGHTSRTR